MLNTKGSDTTTDTATNTTRTIHADVILEPNTNWSEITLRSGLWLQDGELITGFSVKDCTRGIELYTNYTTNCSEEGITNWNKARVNSNGSFYSFNTNNIDSEIHRIIISNITGRKVKMEIKLNIKAKDGM